MSDDDLRKILTDYKRVAIVGLSPNRVRPSHAIGHFLMAHGYEVTGVRPGVSEIHGVRCYESIEQVPPPLEIVDVFRASEHVPALVEQLVSLPPERRPKVLWLQEGVEHSEAEAKARAAEIVVVSNRCILKEHRRLVS